MARKHTLILIQLLAYLLLRMCFEPLEFTGDSYGYSCEVLKGQLHSGHHLFHKYVLSVILDFYNHSYFDSEPLSPRNYNPLIIFSRFNLMVSVLNLLLVWLILENRKWKVSSIALSLLFLSSTFSFIKYSFENETYMLPLFFSLLGTFIYEKKYWTTAFIFLSIAPLFHQTHIFWLLALWIHLPKQWTKKLLYLLLSAGIILGTYFVFTKVHSQSLNQLLFQDVNNGLVQLIPNTSNIKLTVVNFIRTFFQVHGEIQMFWQVYSPLLFIFAVLSICFISVGFYLYWKSNLIRFKSLNFLGSYRTAFILHLLFAAYSVGNIEFMIVLPFLLVLSFTSDEIFNHSLFVFLGLLMWNFTQFAFPRSKLSPSRLKNKLEIISDIWQKQSDSLTLAIEEKDFHQNYFEYQRLTTSTKLDIHCIEIGSQLPADLTLVHNQTIYSRKKITAKSIPATTKEHTPVYRDSSVLGSISVFTN